MSRILSLLTLILFFGCSANQKATRTPASFHWRPGEVSASQSQIRLLSIKTVNQEEAYFFYFEGRDQFGDLIDFDPDELSFVTNEQSIPFDFFRDSLGKYYYRIFFRSIPLAAKSLIVLLRGEPISEIHLKHQDKLAVSDIKNSKMRVVKYEDYTYHFELELIDSKGRPVKSSEKPEFIIEGNASLHRIFPIGPGKWRGELRILDTNSIIYLSPRLNSNQLSRLLRIQHIEK
ncbi:MAG: hypothetical protein WCY48_03645 [Candidatus Caldatribacteriota bacterium]